MHVHVLCGCMEVTVRSHQFKQGWDGMGWDRREDSLQRPYSSADEGACVTILALAYYLLGAVDYCTLPPCTRTREGQDFIRLPQIVHPRQARRPEAHSQLEDFPLIHCRDAAVGEPSGPEANSSLRAVLFVLL